MRIIAGILQVAGLVALGHGLWQYEPWVMWVVCGSLVLLGGVMVDLMVGK